MSFLLYFLFVFSFTIIHGEKLKRIESITGSVHLLETDSESNIYAYTEDSVLYKLNSQLDVVFKKNIKDVFQIIVTPLNYVWIMNPEHIYRVKPNSKEVDHATSYSQPFKHGCYQHAFYTDSEGTLLYNSADEGISMMRCDSETPNLIVNLENHHITSYMTDSEGHSYLTASTFEDNRCSSKLAVLYSHEMKNTAPIAEIFDGPNHPLKSNPSFVSEFDKNLIVGYNGDHARLHMFKKDSMGQLKVLYTQPSFTYYNFHPAKDYIYFFGKNRENECWLNVGNLISNDETEHSFHIIKQIKLVEAGLCGADTKVLSNSDGTLFIASTKQLYRFEAGGSKMDHVSPFNESVTSAEYQYTDYYRKQNMNKILSVIMDQYENLWVLGKGELFILKKGMTVAEPVTNSTFVSEKGVLRINKATEEILVGCDKESSADSYYWQKEKGLYAFSPVDVEKKE